MMHEDHIKAPLGSFEYLVQKYLQAGEQRPSKSDSQDKHYAFDKRVSINHLCQCGEYGLCPLCGSGYIGNRSVEGCLKRKSQDGSINKTFYPATLTPQCFSCLSKGDPVPAGIDCTEADAERILRSWALQPESLDLQ